MELLYAGATDRMLTATLLSTTLVTVILVIKFYQTVNITLHSTVSSRTYNQGVATEWIPLLQKDVPGLMQKTEEKQITSLKCTNHATFKRIRHFGDRAHFSPQSGFNPRGDGRLMAFLRPIFLVVPSCCWMHRRLSW